MKEDIVYRHKLYGSPFAPSKSIINIMKVKIKAISGSKTLLSQADIVEGTSAK